MSRLTHVDESGAARMVDVGGKDVTVRVARAAGRLGVSAEVVRLLRSEGVPKGDALGVARVAGILAAKRTPELIPLCHPLAISGVTVDLAVVDDAVEIVAEVRTTDRTGVEMEALTAVAVAGLALHDMVKAVDPAAVLTDVRVLSKTGGRSGEWRRAEPDSPAAAPAGGSAAGPVPAGDSAPAAGPAPGDAAPAAGPVPGDAAPAAGPAPGDSAAGLMPAPGPTRSPGLPRDARARVVTVSDRSHAGARHDRSGPLLADLLRALGFAVEAVTVVPDEVDAVTRELRAAVADAVDLVVTTGGTGFAPRDVTPEATRQVVERDAPGLVETLRAVDRERVPTTILSRGVAGTAGRTIIVNLPGSTGGVRDGVAVLAPVIGHAVDQLRGGGDHG